MEYQKPLPVILEDGLPYWEGTRNQKLLLQRCTACQRYQFPMRALCSHCWSRDLEVTEASGRGTVFSFTVVYRPPSAGFEVPYVVAIVVLDEGPRMMSGIVDCDPEVVRVEMPVQVTFREATADVTLPYFSPAASS